MIPCSSCDFQKRDTPNPKGETSRRLGQPAAFLLERFTQIAD